MEDPLDITTIADLRKVFNAEIRASSLGNRRHRRFPQRDLRPLDRGPVANPTSDPDMPVFQQTEEMAFSRNDVPASQMGLEEQNYSIPGLAVQGDGANGIGKDGTADVKTLSSPQPAPDDVTGGKTSDLTIPSNRLPETEPPSSIRNDDTETKTEPEKQDYSKMSDLTIPDMPVFHQTEEVPFSRDAVPASQMKLEEQNCSIPGLAVQGDGGKGIGRDETAYVEILSSPQRAPDDVKETETPDSIIPSNELFETESTSPTRNEGTETKTEPEKQDYSKMSDLTIPDMPVFHQTEEVPFSRDAVPASQMKLEEQNCSIPGLAVQGDGGKGIGRDETAYVEILSSPQRAPDDVKETETPDSIIPSNELFETESTSPTRNEGTETKTEPRKQNYSRMSDLTIPANRLPEPAAPSPEENDANETKTESEKQNYSEISDLTLPSNRLPETKSKPTSPTTWNIAKSSDLSTKEAPDVELSAPTKGMVIDEGDDDPVEAGKTATVILNSIVFSAVKERASDIHIEPLENKLCIRYRIDGVLRHKADLPRSIAAALTTRVKVLSGLDIAERRRHQDGRIEARIADRDIDLRVSTYAALWGENVVIRILNRETALVDINALGLSPLNLDRYLRLLTYPAGIILVTGPTGSGKTTTLYASLMRLRDTGIKIITVEDPVEYTIEGVVQGRLDSRPDLSYEDFIKSMMRQDPDVIMIGEIRDEAGAAASMQASLTGHKVLTSFHTDDTVSAILRLMDMNIQPFLISSTIVGIMAQRLVRTLCPFCKEATRPDDSVMRTFTSVKTKGACEAYTFYRAVGCPKCDNTGYRGRTGVHELLEINEPVREAILARKTSSQIRLAARESADLVSMAEDGFCKAAQGITTLQEVLRLVFVNACDASVPYNAENLIAYCDGAEDSKVLQLPKVHNRA